MTVRNSLAHRYGSGKPFMRPTVIIHRRRGIYDSSVFNVLGPGLPWMGLECLSFQDAMAAVDEWWEARR